MDASWKDKQEMIGRIHARLEEIGYNRQEIVRIQNWWSNFNQEPEWWLTAPQEEVEEAADAAWADTNEKYEQAQYRIAKMDFTEEDKEFIFADWNNWEEHIDWLLIAAEQEIKSWIGG